MLTWKQFLEQRQTLGPRMIAALHRVNSAYKRMGQTMLFSDVINLAKHHQGYAPFVSWAQSANFTPNHPVDYILKIYSQQA